MMRADGKSALDADERGFVQQDSGRSLAAVEVRGCPAPALLSAAAVDALPADLLAAVLAHLEVCGICRQLSADLQEVEPAFEMMDEARIRRRVDRRRHPLPRVAALAASLGAAAAAAMLMTNAARPGVIPDVRQPARVVAPGPQVSVLVADKLPPQIGMGALNWRASGDRYELDLATALKPYSDNKFKAAGAALERLSTRYPARSEPLLYLGICRLLMDRPVEAEQALRRAVSLGGSGVDDARWYLAVAAYQNGKRGDARQLLAQVCSGNGARAAEACLAHDQIGDSR